MPRKTNARKQWVYAPPKPSKPKVSDEFKAEVKEKADRFVETFLKPNFIKPPSQDTRFNYIVDIYTKWYRSYFYFCSKYRCPSPHCISEFSEAKFTRLEYVGGGKFNMAFMRHTGQWVETQEGMPLEDCLESIKSDPFYQP